MPLPLIFAGFFLRRSSPEIRIVRGAVGGAISWLATILIAECVGPSVLVPSVASIESFKRCALATIIGACCGALASVALCGLSRLTKR